MKNNPRTMLNDLSNSIYELNLIYSKLLDEEKEIEKSKKDRSKSILETIVCNVDNVSLSDEQFRDFIRNTLGGNNVR